MLLIKDHAVFTEARDKYLTNPSVTLCLAYVLIENFGKKEFKIVIKQCSSLMSTYFCAKIIC